MEGGRALLCLVLVASAIVSVWCSGEAAAVNGYQPPTTPGLDTNVLCVSKCGTCPMVCSSPPAPPSSGAGDNSVTPPPPTPKSGSGGYSSPPGQGKGGQPSSYYYLYTAAASRMSCAGAGVYAVVLLALVSVVASFR